MPLRSGSTEASPNLAVDTDAQLRTLAALAPVGRRSLLRYTGAIGRVSISAIEGVPALRSPSPFWAAVSWTSRTKLRPRSAVGLPEKGEHGQSRAPRHERPRFSALVNAADLRQPRASRVITGTRLESPEVQSIAGRCLPRAVERSAAASPLRVRHNRSVNSDALRQGAAQCRWKSCTVRPLAATCRSPSR